MPDTFDPPPPTYTGGSAVMSAVEPDGTEWQYDNSKQRWVNLKTGEGLAPRDFSARATGSRNAADNTTLLADQMRQEEAALTEPLTERQQIVPPRSPIQPPPIPAVAYSPQDVARVQAQAPVPSTVVPPSPEAWNQAIGRDPAGASEFFKTQQQAEMSRAMMDWTRKAREVGVQAAGPPPMMAGKMSPSFWGGAKPVNQQFHQGGAFNPATGEWTPLPGIKVPPPKLSEVEKASLNSQLREVDSEESDARKALNAAQKAIAGGGEMDAETAKANAALSAISKARAKRQKIIGQFGSPAPAPAVSPTAVPVPVAAPVSVPTGEPPKVTTQAQFDALPPGSVYIGTDGKKKRKL